MAKQESWEIFTGKVKKPTNRLVEMNPPPPPWRRSASARELVSPKYANKLEEKRFLEAEMSRAAPFRASEEMVRAVNTALYLRRPLLLTGKPGTGKSTLISKVAWELKLGPVLRWPITSRSTVRAGVYEYDAVARLQAGKGDVLPAVEDYLTLGPLGTALAATTWPRALLIDEIDKSDLDFANDLLNVIEEGNYEIPELYRLRGDGVRMVPDAFKTLVPVEKGMLQCGQFPFVVMTSNAEREFPAPFLRRCVRLSIEPPSALELAEIVKAHLDKHFQNWDSTQVQKVIDAFDEKRKANEEVATDQLLSAVFLTIGMKDGREKKLDMPEYETLRAEIMAPLTNSPVKS